MSKATLNPTLSPRTAIVASLAAVLVIGGLLWVFLGRSPARQLQVVKLPPGVHPGRPAVSQRMMSTKGPAN